MSDALSSTWKSTVSTYAPRPIPIHAALQGLLCQLRLGSEAHTEARLGLSIARTTPVLVQLFEKGEGNWQTDVFRTQKTVRFYYTDSLFDILVRGTFTDHDFQNPHFGDWVELHSDEGHVVDDVYDASDDEGLLWESKYADQHPPGSRFRGVRDGGYSHAKDLVDRWGRQLFREQNLGPVVMQLVCQGPIYDPHVT